MREVDPFQPVAVVEQIRRKLLQGGREYDSCMPELKKAISPIDGQSLVHHDSGDLPVLHEGLPVQWLLRVGKRDFAVSFIRSCQYAFLHVDGDNAYGEACLTVFYADSQFQPLCRNIGRKAADLFRGYSKGDSCPLL